MYPGTHIERATSDYALATFRDLYIVIWHRNTTMTGAQAVRRGCFAFAESRPKGVALLTIVEEEAPMPASEPRESLATFMRDASDHIKASAVVFEGTGFRAAAVRSVVVGLTMLARQKYPHKVFSGLIEATAWMERELAAAKLAESFTAQELGDAIASLRRALTQREPDRDLDSGVA
jgi:hypothetical protein